jgi:membrane protein
MTAGRLPRMLALRPVAAVVSLARDWLERFVAVQGIDRAVAIGAQGYTALFPLLIVYVALLPTDRDFAESIVERFELSGAAAESVHQAFAPSGTVQSSVTALGVVLLIVSALSFSRALQRLYERSFGLPTLGMRNTTWGLLWLAAVCLFLGLRPPLTGGLRATAEVVVSLGFSGALWLMTPYLLLGRRLSAATLFPVAVLTTIGMTGVGVWSVIWMPRTLASLSREFGVIGVGFALLTWCIAVGVVLVIAATGGAMIADRWDHRQRDA